MGTHERSRRRLPSVEGLEGRLLLTTSSSYYSAIALAARHQYDQYVTDMQSIELQSRATPTGIYLALPRRHPGDLEGGFLLSLPPAAVAAKGGESASIQIDQSLLYGSLSDQAWAGQTTRLEQTLSGL